MLKQNKSDGGQQILYNISYIWNLKKKKREQQQNSKLMGTEDILALARGREWNSGRNAFFVDV